MQNSEQRKMYEVGKKDKVVELKGVPQSSIGAPTPTLLASEHDLFLVYYLEDRPDDWDGTTVRVVGIDSEDETTAIIKFSSCYAHMFGPPNDEAFSGHPLSGRGLGPYSVFEVKHSSWLRNLEQMNSVHPVHDTKSFLKDKKHFIFTFHDSTFECIAHNFEIQIRKGSIRSIISSLAENLN